MCTNTMERKCFSFFLQSLIYWVTLDLKSCFSYKHSTTHYNEVLSRRFSLLMMLSDWNCLFSPTGWRLPGDGRSSPEDGVSVLAVLWSRDCQWRAAGLLRPAADDRGKSPGRAAVDPCELDTTHCRVVRHGGRRSRWGDKSSVTCIIMAAKCGISAQKASSFVLCLLLHV